MSREAIALGLRANWRQFTLLVIINAFVGALASGLLADAWGIPSAIAAVAGLTFLSGAVVATVMYETLPAWRPAAPNPNLRTQLDHAK
jgi:hypothetical protein